MSVLIKNIHIKNFKSVRDLSLDCERINIFIGKPNAGKSNILEAISLLGAGYSTPNAKFAGDFIRYKTIKQLFNNFDFTEPLTLRADDTHAELRVTSWGTSKFKFSISSPPPEEENNWKKLIDSIDFGLSLDGDIFERYSKDREEPSPVKKYDFRFFSDYREKGLFLNPPFGENFYDVARSNSALKEEIRRFLKPNNLDFLLDVETHQMSVIQKEADSFLRIPMALVPDTFQRYIFHLAAILSNRDSVLLFEEPESHSYPPYINQLAQHIVDDEGGNQFFITTHNPYLLTPILQEAKDVALFVTWFENFQTHARRLSEAELSDILSYGMDVFFNLKHFTPHEPSPDFA